MSVSPSRQTCVACAGPLEPGWEACPACRSPVFQPSRRVVTVLFADLAGYTSLGSRLDIEAVHVLVRPVMNALRSLCEDLGGVVPSIAGDGFMAVFGALTTREDDPARGVAAAVAMMRWMEVRRGQRPTDLPPLRIGLNTAEVLVAPSWETSGFSISGDGVNVASRLCQAAEPGRVLCSSEVARLVPGGWSDARWLTVRNRGEAVSVRELDWSDAPRQGGAAASTTRWVDRQALDDLSKAVGRSAVLLHGPAGAGKSRLVEEWAALEGYALLRCRVPAFGRGTQPSTAQQLVRCLPPDEAFQRSDVHGRRLRRLRGVGVDAVETDTRDECVEALVTQIAQLGEGVAVLVDDVQWADAEDRLLVEALVRRLRGTPVRLVVVSRELLDVDGAAPLALTRMTDAELTALVEAVIPGAPPAVRHALVARSGGLPLFLEQCARLLVDEGAVVVDETGSHLKDAGALHRIPVVMRLFVTARLDALAPRLHELLGAAAVLGDEIDVDLLCYLLGERQALTPHLDDLVDRGFLRWVPGPAGAPRLAFRHQVVREVAYEGLLIARRIEIHLAASDWYAALPFAELLGAEAQHLEAVLALGSEDCTVVRRAVATLVSYAHSIVEERTALALETLERAARLVEQHPACAVPVLDLVLRRSQALELVGREQEAIGQARLAGRLAAEAGSLEHQAEAALALGRSAALIDPVSSEHALAEAGEYFDRLGDRSGTGRVAVARTRAARGVGANLLLMEQAYAAVLLSGDARLRAVLAQEIAMFVAIRSRTEADRWRTEAEAMLRRDDLVGRARLQGAEAMLAYVCGDSEDAHRAGEATWEAGRAAGALQVAMNGLVIAAEGAVLSGRLPEALALVDTGLAQAAERPSPHLSVDLGFSRALLLARQGQPGEGLRLLDALDPHIDDLNPTFRREAHQTRGQLLLDAGRFADAEVAATAAVEMDLALDQPGLALRSRFLRLVAASVQQKRSPLREVTQFQSDARSFGAGLLSDLMARWYLLEDALDGHRQVAVEAPSSLSHPMARALDLELRALTERRPEDLLAAAASWDELGRTVWSARARLWHAELTGASDQAALEELAALDAPDGLADSFRRQLRKVAG